MRTDIMSNKTARTGITMLIALLVAVAMSHGQADTSLPPTEDGGPVRVEIAVFVLDVNKINSADQSYTANVFYRAQWRDSRLAHEGSGKVTYKLTQVWDPALQIVNQQKMFKTMPEIVNVTPEGLVTYRQRAWGDLSQRLKLHDFPFDTQVFHVDLVAAGYTPGEVKLVPTGDDILGLAPELSLSDWEIDSWDAKSVPYRITPWMQPGAGFEFTFTAHREFWYFITMIILPLILIVCMSWLTYWINPEVVAPQISVAVTAMLTLIAYRFAIGNSLPKLSYLTRMDIFIFFSTFLVFTTLLEVILVTSLARSDHLQAALRIDRCARWVFPLALAAAIVFAFVV